MLSDFLFPTLCTETYDIKKYKFIKEQQGKCGMCLSMCNKKYITYIENEKICTKTCYLCHIIVNFKKYHLNKIFLIDSQLSQLEINQNILNYHMNYKQIPLPNIIDNSCKIIKGLTFYDYMQNTSLFTNLKIYFNPNVLSHMIDITPSFFSKKPTENDLTFNNYLYISNFYDELNKIPQFIIKNKKKYEKNTELIESEKSFQIKINKLNTMSKIKSDLLQCMF